MTSQHLGTTSTDPGTQDPATSVARTVLARHPRDEHGITTAEYAVGTAAGAGFAALLYTMLSGGFGRDLLGTLFDHVLSLLGLG